MTNAGAMIRAARRAEGLTQRELGERLGVSQAAVAQLESSGDSVTVGTLQRAAAALGRTLELRVTAPQGSVDESLVAAQLRLTPAQRLERYDHDYEQVREFAHAGALA